MQEINLLYFFLYSDPGKNFLVCDLTDIEGFPDPLEIIKLPDYDPHNVNREGLFAIGAEPTITNMLSSYNFGIFPWYPFTEEVPYWYCPRERFVIFPEKIHVGHTLRNLLNKNKYHITINRAFRDVIHKCSVVNHRQDMEGAWLGETIKSRFIELHELGYAKSVEVWEEDRLVGGFYGFWHKGVFQGESMFSLAPSASQIGLVLLCRNPYIEGEKIKLIDTQYATPVFKKLGGEFIPYSDYRRIMDTPLKL